MKTLRTNALARLPDEALVRKLPCGFLAKNQASSLSFPDRPAGHWKNGVCQPVDSGNGPQPAHRTVSLRNYVGFALRTIIMEYDMDSLILNVLRSLPPCQIQAGEANERYSASVCKKNEPDPLPCPVFRP